MTVRSAAQNVPTAHRLAVVLSQLSQIVVGKEEPLKLALACLLARGHLLIEDIPGVGKTLLAQALAASVGGSFHRIQGTPDLLPGDVTGTMVPHGDTFELRFRPGPIFSNIVVFDELNRANPRTQSALLEATEEGAVTVDGSTRELPSPFLLVATQNPVEMTGTYPLGEGALDRFTAVVTPGRASAAHEVEVLTGRRGRNVLRSVEPVVDIGDVAVARAAVASTYVADGIARYVVAILDATREHPRVHLVVPLPRLARGLGHEASELSDIARQRARAPQLVKLMVDLAAQAIPFAHASVESPGGLDERVGRDREANRLRARARFKPQNPILRGARPAVFHDASSAAAAAPTPSATRDCERKRAVPAGSHARPQSVCAPVRALSMRMHAHSRLENIVGTRGFTGR